MSATSDKQLCMSKPVPTGAACNIVCTALLESAARDQTNCTRNTES
jgi:hypothetical protein